MPMPYVLLPTTGNDQVDEWIKLGNEAQMAERFPSAEKHYRAALRLVPCHPIASTNLAVLLARQGQLNEGLLAMERATLYDGVEPIIASNRALMALEADRLDDANAAAAIAMSLAPDAPTGVDDEPLKAAGYLNARLAAAMVATISGYPAKAYPLYQEMLKVDPKHGAAGPNACFVQSLLDVGPAELLKQRHQWREANGWKSRFKWAHKNDRDPNRVLKVGYLSGDFKSHSAAMMFSHVVMNHDRQRVEPFLYSTIKVEPDKDDMSAMFQAVGNWRDVLGKTDEEIEDMITADQIDILVDLAAHTNGGRLAVFTRKPAPIAVTAWGFAHGTGLEEIDYFLADPIAVPVEERQHYAEKIFDVPCIVTYRPPVEYGIRPTSPLPFHKNEYITFGSFSRHEKTSDECLAAFAEILRRVPNSRLYLKDHAYRRPYSIRRVLNALEGIHRDRVIFGVATSHPEHMLTYQTVDIILDTMPHGAGVVCLEALYTGVPLITKNGQQPAGRTASSVLTAMGRTEWITRSNEEYIEKAVEWAGRIQDLSAARKTLRDELLNSPVINGYPRAIENAFREMWQTWCKS